jgi:Mrp family chromosome partitioning ATPase
MRSDGIETLKAVARRSVWIVGASVLLGILAMNAMRQSQGAQYAATSKVVLSPVDLSSALTGVSNYVDPDLLDQTEKALASSPDLFRRVATDSGGTLGTPSEIASATSVSKDGGTVSFQVTGPNPDRVVGIANGVADTYPTWRGDVQGAAVAQAIKQVRASLRGVKTPNPDLLDQLHRLQVLKTLTSGNVLLTEEAHGATKTRPTPLRDSLLGAFIGLFAALLIVAAREAIETRVRSETEVEETLNAPVIGSIETLPRRTTVVTGRGAERYQDMYSLLAANLTKLDKPAGRATVIAVTSATPEEGKTTTASNIAAALARRNAHVVLVDLDTRKPSLSKVFNIPAAAPGIAEVIAGKGTPDDAMWTVSLNGYGLAAEPPLRSRRAAQLNPRVSANGDGAGSLRVLPIGTTSDDALVRHLRRLDGVLKDLSQRAEYVIIDTPPALSVPNMTEVAELVDMVLVVVRHGRVSRRSLAALTRLQRNWSNPNLAAVLVGTPRYQESYSYYGSGLTS